MIVIVMGVSGSGKTTIGKELSNKLGIPFYDADNFHPKENIQKMAKGTPLNDGDRIPWLKSLADLLHEWQSGKGAVLACSALKESYRRILQEKVEDVKWVYLEGTKETIAKRMDKRRDHFMKPGMLDSQFEALEPPTYGYRLSILKHPQAIVELLYKKLGKNE